MPVNKDQVTDPDKPPFERLVRLMEVLRSPEGCAWDRKQTHQSLIPYLIEEAYEVVEAIEGENFDELREELGDLLVQVVFHAQLAAEADRFTINDSIVSVVNKLIARHPHVFGERKALDPKQVRDQWEQIKVDSGEKDRVLAGVPKAMPALNLAFRVGEKAGGVGFDWKEPEDVLLKLEEEIAEIRERLEAGDRKGASEEIGDLLFATSSLARKLDADPERILREAVNKFIDRFGRLEDQVKASGRRFKEFTLDELEAIWQSIK
ncbi:MAG: nucleoside triphosphate pyrophosphohydrolase [Candidatus Micrarchaeota archaeon]